MDARQSRLGWVLFLDWHYTFMMQTNEEARAECRVWRKGQVRGSGEAGFDLGRPGHVLLFVLLYRNKRAGSGKR